MKTRLLQQLINNEGTDPIPTTTKPPLRNHTELLGKHQLLHRLQPHVNTMKILMKILQAFYLSRYVVFHSFHTLANFDVRQKISKFRKVSKFIRGFFCPSMYDVTLLGNLFPKFRDYYTLI
jgi:hypothetical protein